MTGEKLYSRTQKAPQAYKEARYAYIDSLLIRIHEQWNETDVTRLKIMYSPILDQIKRELKRTFQRANADDLENTIHSRFIHLLWKYTPSATDKMSFSMWLKKYLKGWCYRMMNDIMGTGRKSGRVLASAIRDSELNGHYADVVGASEEHQHDAGYDAKVLVLSGVGFIKEACGDKAADAFAFKHHYNMTQSEIAQILGCTQAKVSKILVEAENVFRDKLQGRFVDARGVSEDDDGEGEGLHGPE